MKDFFLWPYRAIRFNYRKYKWRRDVRDAITKKDMARITMLSKTYETYVRFK